MPATTPGRLRLGASAARELDAADLVMTGVPVRDGDKSDVMLEDGVLDGDPAGLDVAVIGVRAENEDA